MDFEIRKVYSNVGPVLIYVGDAARQLLEFEAWYDDPDEDDLWPPEPLPTVSLDEERQARVVFACLRGPIGQTGPPGAMGLRGPSSDASS